MSFHFCCWDPSTAPISPISNNQPTMGNSQEFADLQLSSITEPIYISHTPREYLPSIPDTPQQPNPETKNSDPDSLPHEEFVWNSEMNRMEQYFQEELANIGETEENMPRNPVAHFTYDHQVYLQWLYEREAQDLPCLQTYCIHAKNRERILDWMFRTRDKRCSIIHGEEAHTGRILPMRCVFTSVSILDRYGSRALISSPTSSAVASSSHSDPLMLYAFTAFYMGYRYENSNGYIKARHGVEYTKNPNATVSMVRKTERQILQALQFRIMQPHARTFIEALFWNVNYTHVSFHLFRYTVYYYSETALYRLSFLDIPPSRIAFASIYLALRTVSHPPCVWKHFSCPFPQKEILHRSYELACFLKQYPRPYLLQRYRTLQLSDVQLIPSQLLIDSLRKESLHNGW